MKLAALPRKSIRELSSSPFLEGKLSPQRVVVVFLLASR